MSLYKTILLTWQNESHTISRKVLKQIAVSELQPDETVDAVREARLLAKVSLICINTHILLNPASTILSIDHVDLSVSIPEGRLVIFLDSCFVLICPLGV